MQKRIKEKIYISSYTYIYITVVSRVGCFTPTKQLFSWDEEFRRCFIISAKCGFGIGSGTHLPLSPESPKEALLFAYRKHNQRRATKWVTSEWVWNTSLVRSS